MHLVNTVSTVVEPASRCINMEAVQGALECISHMSDKAVEQRLA